MIFITAKFPVKPEHADAWPEISRAFTEATRAEEGCLWFEWSRSLDDPHEYVLVEAFRDDDAGGAHVGSDALHRRAGRAAAVPGPHARDRQHRASTRTDWNELGRDAGRLSLGHHEGRPSTWRRKSGSWCSTRTGAPVARKASCTAGPASGQPTGWWRQWQSSR